MDTHSFRLRGKAITGRTAALLTCFIILGTLLLTGCWPAATAVPSPTAAPASPTAPPTTPPTATSVPTETAVPSPTNTPTVTPTLTPTATLTATPVPAVLSDGFDAWCLPGDSPNRGVVTSKMPSDAGRYKQLNTAIQLTVPMGSCTFVYTFNQPVPADAEFQIYDILDHLAYKLPLNAVDGQPNVGLVTLTYPVMLAPPYYLITFRMAVYTPENGQMWTSKVNFARPLPAPCFDNIPPHIYPDPVTGACPAADPREPEYCRKPGSISCYFRNVHTEK